MASANRRYRTWADFYTSTHLSRAYFARLLDLETATIKDFETSYYPDGVRRKNSIDKMSTLHQFIFDAICLITDEGLSFKRHAMARTIVQQQYIFDEDRERLRRLWT